MRRLHEIFFPLKIDHSAEIPELTEFAFTPLKKDLKMKRIVTYRPGKLYLPF